MDNPEIQFRRQYRPDYTGMNLTELTFCRMEDYSGVLRDYKLDFITPQESCLEPLPIVLFIHGGGFTEPCDKRQSYISVFARELTQCGYAVISPDYPIFESASALEKAGGEPAGYDKAAQAVHLAYCYIREKADALRFDPNRIGIIGGSAGGWASFYAVTQHRDHYKAMINLWGAPQILPESGSFPPLFSVHGTEDTLVPYEREKAVQDALELAGIPHKLVTLNGCGHTPLGSMNEFLPGMLNWLDTYL